MLSGLISLSNRARIIAGLAILVLVAGIFWVYSSRPASVEEAPYSISVTSLHSDVFIKEPGAEFELVEQEAAAIDGSSIRTSATGRALIESSAAHRTLVDYSSEIILNESAGNRTRVGLLGGAVWSRVEKIFDSGEYYEITSGNAVAAVRGTSFGMWYQSGVTTLIVLEGSVVFSAIGAEGLPVPGSEVTVTPGMKAVRDGNRGIVVTSLTKEDRALPWVLFNDSEESPGAVPSAQTASPAPASGSGAAPTVPAPDGQPSQPAVPSPVPVRGSEISDVTPSRIDEYSDRQIFIQGSGFTEATSVQVGSTKVRYEILRDTTIAFYADNVGRGTHDITVVGAGTRSATRARALTVVEAVAEDPQDPSPGFNQDPAPR